MRLVIRARSLQNEPLSKAIIGEFDERGGTIGRSDTNTMTLPDPERLVSRLQAEVSNVDGVFSIRNVGSASTIIVSGRPISPGEAVGLHGGERMTIGGYELHVALADAVGGSVTATDARAVISASAREGRTNPPPRQSYPSAPAASDLDARADPFKDLLSAPASPGAVDPFADLMGEPATPGSDVPRKQPAPPAQGAAQLPSDFDPFADVTPPPASSPGPGDDDPFKGLLADRQSAPGNLDHLFGLQDSGPAKDSSLDAFLAPDAAASPAATDPFAFLAPGRQASKAPAGPATGDHTPELRGAYRPPPVRAPTPRVAAAGPHAGAAAPAAGPSIPVAPSIANASADALWDAFCDGAQLSLPVRQRLTPELMQLIGATLRHAVEGIVQLSAARTTTKRELQVLSTVIKVRNNNPLKFAPDAAAAMSQLMQPPMRGFMAAPEAVQDMMADLLGHTVGTMAGTRAAMQGMLARFEPVQLESQLAAAGMLETLLPMSRRAKLWELYLQHYDRIRDSAREDFDELFGKAFAKAYEEHASRVSAAVRNPR